MGKLRAAVRNLQEDEIFERTLLRGPDLVEEQQPTSNDIDAILRSMMSAGPVASSRAPTEPAGSPLPIHSPVPSNASLVGAFTLGSTSDTSTTSASKRPSKSRSKGKSKKT